MDQDTNQNRNEQLESLETTDEPSQVIEPSTSNANKINSTPPATPISEASANSEAKSPKITPPGGRFSRVRSSFNIYLLIFALLVLIAIIVTFVAYQRNRQSLRNPLSGGPESSQELNEDVLNQLRNTDVKLGDPKQILTVEANAVFAGSILVRGDFEVAGGIRSSGPLNVSGLNVAGTGTFQTLQANDLQLSGSGQVQGDFVVQGSLSTSGSANFGGTLSASKLSVQALELAGDLIISRHLISSGGNPGSSTGNAVGGGGTTSVSGSDTAGTININTGGGPTPGCFITINFTQRFSQTPHVVITPLNGAAAGVNYYVNRSTSNFSVCTSSPAPGGQNLSFDYIVVG